MLKGKKVLIGISGSIAAYKSILLTRLLVKAGAEVKVVMTPAGADFVSPLTLSTLSGNPVQTDLFHENTWSNHVMLGRWADIMVIAPLTVNTLAKMAAGACDNLLLATYLSATCKVMVAPAMDEDMWHHPATQKNLDILTSYGNIVVPVGHGELASGLYGQGRMAEPEDLFSLIQQHLNNAGSAANDLKGKKALVTAGPTHEALDPVRYIGNYSTGKMGVSIADELARRGADVTLVLGPSSVRTSDSRVKTIPVVSGEEMFTACKNEFSRADIIVMAAAVADYAPVNRQSEKIKKSEEEFTISLKKNPDILKWMGENKTENQVLTGFALETTNERDYAQKKLKQKNADIIVLNSLNDKGAGFGTDTNKITIFTRNGKEMEYGLKDKSAVAKDIVDAIITFAND
ncbi:MAG TPA: bifunctional phosphopantothenoylcysteine decarboxylase/phosphopantothenate--cysteine ligase CoaBC [Parasegetibacter sp.]